MSTKAKRAEIQTPETLLWAASFEYKITLPIDECVDRLQIRFGSRASFVSTDQNTVKFSIRKPPNPTFIRAWATGDLEAAEDELTIVRVTVGIDPQLIFISPLIIAFLIMLWQIRQAPLIAILFLLSIIGVLIAVNYFGAKHERENLLLEFEETLE